MPEFTHKPVLLEEVLEAVQPRPGGRYVDGTIGGGGHASAILERSSPDGWLDGFDRDAEALSAARDRLARYPSRFELRQENFAEMGRWLEAGTCDGVLLDLGVSSHQLEQGERGFSFQQDGPLDMRMDRRSSVTAADVVNEFPVEELAKLFREYGDEPQAWRIAQAIDAERRQHALTRTLELARLIERVAPRHGKKIHPATKVFQALRIEVNQEVEAIERGLEAGLQVLKPGGRLAIITFHSLEERIVKRFGRERERDYTFDGPVDDPHLRRPAIPTVRWVQRKALAATPEEQAENPRSRSAHLRVMEKL